MTNTNENKTNNETKEIKARPICRADFDWLLQRLINTNL